MNAKEAYPMMPDYEERARQRFEIGDVVWVGPAYQMPGPLFGSPETYECDGNEGYYYRVCAISGDRSEYGLGRFYEERGFSNAPDIWMSPTRMQHVLVGNVDNCSTDMLRQIAEVRCGSALGRYCNTLADARTCREAGNLQDAMNLERLAEKLYRELPAVLKWREGCKKER